MKRHYLYPTVLTILLLALLTACAAGPLAYPETGAPAGEDQPATLEEVMTDSEFYAANPELMTVNRFPAAVPEAPLTDSEFYAANPELMTVNRFPAAVPEAPLTESEFYAANPELMTVNRFPAAVPEAPLTESEFYAANPELMTANRFPAAVPEAPLTESEFYAANPELMSAGRYATELVEPALNVFPRTDRELEFTSHYLGPSAQNYSSLDAFLEANPELRFARRYLEAVFEE